MAGSCIDYVCTSVVCGAYGRCTGTNKCTCYEGYTGVNCTIAPSSETIAAGRTAILSFPFNNCDSSIFTNEFKTNFSRGILQAADNNKIDSSQISVTNYRCGSIVVDVVILDVALVPILQAVVASGNFTLHIGSAAYSASTITLTSTNSNNFVGSSGFLALVIVGGAFMLLALVVVVIVIRRRRLPSAKARLSSHPAATDHGNDFETTFMVLGAITSNAAGSPSPPTARVVRGPSQESWATHPTFWPTHAPSVQVPPTSKRVRKTAAWTNGVEFWPPRSVKLLQTNHGKNESEPENPFEWRKASSQLNLLEIKKASSQLSLFDRTRGSAWYLDE